MSDKRTIPTFGPTFWAERVSEHEWHDCKYCNHPVPTFILSEGRYGSEIPVQVMRCCWECGSGLRTFDVVSA